MAWRNCLGQILAIGLANGHNGPQTIRQHGRQFAAHFLVIDAQFGARF